MRLWPARRSPRRPAFSPDDAFFIGELLGRSLDGVVEVHDREVGPGVLAFRGRLLIEPARALDLLIERFRALGFTPLLRPEGDGVVVHALPRPVTVEPQRITLNVVLFLLTCATTLLAGALFFASATFDPLGSSSLAAWLLTGVPFAFTLLSILGVHEFGHYFTARYYKASVSLPYFIPAPPIVLFGTFGAIIRMRSPARDRNSLFDIAAAGPLAGLVVAVAAVVTGLAWSRVAPVPVGETIQFGDPLLMQLFVYLSFGPLPEGNDVFLHPVGVAGWAGLLVTALNLFPVGQLDGGRIAYALFGRRHRMVGMAAFAALLLLGTLTGSVNWFVWAGLLLFLVGFHHSPPLDDVTPLTPGRRAVGVLCLLLLVLLVPPVPIQFT
ncbi:MAG: site-2 protease family protein [Candidatus Rokuibacteriota bacterium]